MKIQLHGFPFNLYISFELNPIWQNLYDRNIPLIFTLFLICEVKLCLNGFIQSFLMVNHKTFAIVCILRLNQREEQNWDPDDKLWGKKGDYSPFYNLKGYNMQLHPLLSPFLNEESLPSRLNIQQNIRSSFHWKPYGHLEKKCLILISNISL